MTSDARRTTTPKRRTDDDRPSSEDERKRAPERGQRIGAAQLAAPSTRRWRRPERPGRDG